MSAGAEHQELLFARNFTLASEPKDHHLKAKKQFELVPDEAEQLSCQSKSDVKDISMSRSTNPWM